MFRTHRFIVALLAYCGWIGTLPTESAGTTLFAADQGSTRRDSCDDPLPLHALARLGTLRQRHGGLIMAIAYSPDAKLIASGGYDGPVRIWELSTGRQFRALGPPQGKVRSVDFSPDGKLLAVGYDRGISVWEVATGKRISVLSGNDGSPIFPLTIKFAPDGKHLAAANCGDQTIVLWESLTWHQTNYLRSGNERIFCMDFSPDGKVLATAGDGAVIRMWDLHSRKQVGQLSGHGGWIQSVIFCGHGKTIISSSDDHSIRVWDVISGKQKNCFSNPDWRGKMALQPAEKSVVIGGGSGKVSVLDLETGKTLQQFVQPLNSTWAVGFAKDGETIASGYYGNTLHIWNLSKSAPAFSWPGHQGHVSALHYSPDGKTLASASQDHSIRFWNPVTAKEISRLNSSQGPIYCFTYTPDGKFIIMGGQKEDELTIWDLESRKAVRHLQGQQSATKVIDFAPDGKSFITTCFDDGIYLWDFTSGKLIRNVTDAGGVIASIAYSPDGRFILSSANGDTLRGKGGTLKRWDINRAFAVQELSWDAYYLQSVAFSPDGKTAVSGGKDGIVHLWDVEIGQQITEMKAQSGEILTLAFSPNGRTVASSGKDRIVRIWDIPEQREVARFQGHEGSVRTLCFAPDGKTIASGSSDTTILIWPLPCDVIRPRFSNADIKPDELQRWWNDLGTDNCQKAYHAIWEIAANPKKSVPYLQGQIHPVHAADTHLVRSLMRDLDAENFLKRQQASTELKKLGETALPFLKESLASSASTEASRRIKELIVSALTRSHSQIQQGRALQALELIATPEAKKAIANLVTGMPEARLTQDAKASLKRLISRKTLESANP